MMPPVHWDTIITGLISAAILWGVRVLTKALKDYSAESKAWRSDLTKRIGIINESLVCVMRGDLIHKAHRYVDDKGYASIEEKESWHEEWTQYQSICPRNGFIDALAAQVMALPEHPNKEES